MCLTYKRSFLVGVQRETQRKEVGDKLGELVRLCAWEWWQQVMQGLGGPSKGLAIYSY